MNYFHSFSYQDDYQMKSNLTVDALTCVRGHFACLSPPARTAHCTQTRACSTSAWHIVYNLHIGTNEIIQNTNILTKILSLLKGRYLYVQVHYIDPQTYFAPITVMQLKM